MPAIAKVSSPVLVAIPARNEADELEGCLQALGAQRRAAIDCAVICLNDCTDDSSRVISRIADNLPFRLDVMDVALPPGNPCVGTARRLAMDRAAVLAGAGGILLTTDADGRVPPDWVAANLGAMAAGADAVAGQAEMDPAGAKLLSRHLHDLDAGERGYAALLDEIRSLLDPDPADPWPRHDQHSGASLAVTVAAYRSAGGIPPVALAEDRAFVARLRKIDARIRHAPEIRVVVSARLHGRAPGGMADTLRLRSARAVAFLDGRLEPAHEAARRARICAELRHMWRAGIAESARLRRVAATLQVTTRFLAACFGIPPSESRCRDENSGQQRTYFGAGWAQLEQQSAVLRRRRVPHESLAAEAAQAMRIRDWLKVAEGRAGMPLHAAAE